MTAPTNGPVVLDRYVLETLMPDLVGHDRRPSAFLVYLAIVAAGGDHARAPLSYGQLAERTGLSRRAVQMAVALLRRRQLIRVTRRGITEVSEYEALAPWRR